MRTINEFNSPPNTSTFIMSGDGQNANTNADEAGESRDTASEEPRGRQQAGTNVTSPLRKGSFSARSPSASGGRSASISSLGRVATHNEFNVGGTAQYFTVDPTTATTTTTSPPQLPLSDKIRLISLSITLLIEDLGLKSSLREYDVPREDLAKVAEGSLEGLKGWKEDDLPSGDGLKAVLEGIY